MEPEEDVPVIRTTLSSRDCEEIRGMYCDIEGVYGVGRGVDHKNGNQRLSNGGVIDDCLEEEYSNEVYIDLLASHLFNLGH